MVHIEYIIHALNVHIFTNHLRSPCVKGIVHFEINFWCFSLPQGQLRCSCLCLHSIFNFDIVFKPVLSVSQIMQV